MNKFLIAALPVCAVATILSIISTAIPYWIYHHSKIGDVEGSSAMGLWKECARISTPSSTDSSCVNLIAPDWLKAVQAMMILGILSQAMSTFLVCLFSKYNSKKYFYLGTIFTSVLGGIFIIIAVIVFGVEEKDMSSHFSAGFYLSIISAVLSFVAASLVVIAARSTGGYSLI